MKKEHTQIPKLKDYVDTIKKYRAEREKNCPLKSKIDVPKLGLPRIAKMCLEQDTFVIRETLVQAMLRFYACNTGIFHCVVSEDLRKKVEYKEEFIDECISEIVELIMEGKVYEVCDGVFTAWTATKRKKCKVLTIDRAWELSEMLIDGDF